MDTYTYSFSTFAFKTTSLIIKIQLNLFFTSVQKFVYLNKLNFLIFIGTQVRLSTELRWGHTTFVYRHKLPEVNIEHSIVRCGGCLLVLWCHVTLPVKPVHCNCCNFNLNESEFPSILLKWTPPLLSKAHTVMHSS